MTDMSAEVKFAATTDKGVFYVLLRNDDLNPTNIGTVFSDSTTGWKSYNHDKKFTGEGITRYIAASGLLADYELANGLRDSEGRRVGRDPETIGFWCVLNSAGTRMSKRWHDKADAIAHLASLQPTSDEMVDASRADQDRAIDEALAGHGLEAEGFALTPLSTADVSDEPEKLPEVVMVFADGDVITGLDSMRYILQHMDSADMWSKLYTVRSGALVEATTHQLSNKTDENDWIESKIGLFVADETEPFYTFCLRIDGRA